MAPERPRSPRVSVIVPAFNVTQYISEALESVRAQTYRDFEVIVVNDGCPDTECLEAALQAFAPDIRYAKQKNAGVAAARNTAIQLSRGMYIALLDADDVWEPQYLESQLAFLESHPEFDLVYPDAVIFGDSPLAGRRYMDVAPSTGAVTIEGLLTGTCNVYISVLGKTETFLEAGLFDPALLAAEDFELWLRVLLSGGRIGYQREILARRRKHAESLSADRAVQARRGVDALRKVLGDPRVPAELADLIRRTIDRFNATAELCEGQRALVDGRWTDAMRYVAAANAVFQSRKLALVGTALQIAPGLMRRFYQLRTRGIAGTA